MYAYIINHADNDDLEEPLNGHGRQMLIAPFLPPVDGISIVGFYIQQSLCNINNLISDIYSSNNFRRPFFCDLLKYRST
jgi:hypothetical protein